MAELSAGEHDLPWPTQVPTKDPLVVFEKWLQLDSAALSQARGLHSGGTVSFHYVSWDSTLSEAKLTYEQVQYVLAKLTLQGKIK